MTEVDLDWCICGKKTDLGQLYCSVTCAARDSTHHHQNLYSPSSFSTPSSSPTSTASHNYTRASPPSPPLSPLLNATYPTTTTPPTSYSLGGFQNRSYRATVNIHACAYSLPPAGANVGWDSRSSVGAVSGSLGASALSRAIEASRRSDEEVQSS